MMGVIMAFIGIFMLMAVVSFLFTGAADQSKVLNKSFRELIRSDAPQVENWTGAGGAFIAELLVNDCFGIFSALIPVFLIYIGLRLMKVSDYPFLKALFITAFGLIGGSVTSAFILDNIFSGTHVKWGGAHGIQIEQILESSVGWPGVVLLILLFILIMIVIFRKNSIYKIQQTLVNNKPTLPYKDEEPYTPFAPADTENEEPEAEKGPGMWKRFFAWLKRSERPPLLLMKGKRRKKMPRKLTSPLPL